MLVGDAGRDRMRDGRCCIVQAVLCRQAGRAGMFMSKDGPFATAISRTQHRHQEAAYQKRIL